MNASNPTILIATALLSLLVLAAAFVLFIYFRKKPTSTESKENSSDLIIEVKQVEPSTPSKDAKNAAQPGSMKIPDGFDLAKYKKMVKVRMPEASIRNRIRQDGFDAKLFETLVLGSLSPAKHEPDIIFEQITPIAKPSAPSKDAKKYFLSSCSYVCENTRWI